MVYQEIPGYRKITVLQSFIRVQIYALFFLAFTQISRSRKQELFNFLVHDINSKITDAT